MFAKAYTARVIEKTWLTPTVFRLRFESRTPFSYEAGQFVSVVIPSGSRKVKNVKRCYSLASSPQETKDKGYYELCIKMVDGGKGSSYLSLMARGDLFKFHAPYGHMKLKTNSVEARHVCFIATGSGLAPFRAMALSKDFKQKVASATVLFGVRTEDEIFYQEDFKKAGVKMISAVSKGSSLEENYKGRVTDYLRSLGAKFPWHQTDFYLCGNGEMVAEVSQILEGVHGVSTKAIHKEAFSATAANIISGPGKKPAAKPEAVANGRTVIPLFPVKTAA